jgi:hypothetical protein
MNDATRNSQASRTEDTMTMQATPTKLRNGTWGAKVSSTDVRRGDTVTITTRSGKSWDATVSEVVWTGNGVTICATQSQDRRPAAPRRNRGTWTGCTCGSVEEYEKSSACWTCRHDR